MRFAVCMHAALQLELFVEGAGTLALKLDIEKSSTQIDKEEVRKSRQSPKNTYEFVIRLLTDRNLWRINFIKT